MSTPALRQIQHQFFGFVRRRLDDDYRLRPLPEDGEHSTLALRALVKPNDRLTSEERIELYARQYWFRLIQSFYEDFPGVAALVGPNAFHELSLAYLENHPSKAYTLRRLGQFFPDFVRQREAPVSDKLRPVVTDMARLEWARMDVFDVEELPALSPDDALDGDILALPIGLQPHLRLLMLDHPVDDWWVRMRREEWRAESSNAVAADGPALDDAEAGNKPGIVPPRRRTTRVAIHRNDETVFFKRIGSYAFLLLSAFAAGKTLGTAMETLIPSSTKPASWWRRQLKTWFAEWTSLKWLILREPRHRTQSKMTSP